MYSLEIKELANHTDNKNFMISLGCSKLKKQIILDATSWMNEKTPLKIRCLAIQNNFTKETFPKCPSCGKDVGYDKAYNNHFLKFCSNDCSSKFSKLPKELNDRDWLYQKRVVEKLSYSSIGTLLGCSGFPVTQKCREYDFPRFKLNESAASVMRFLKDKSWLEKEHQIKKKKIHEIASEIGTSGPTVSVWMNKHNIKTNKSNSYDRPDVGVSKECQELIDFIQSLNVETTNNDRSILDGLEIDIVIESHKICIEYNGIYSHLYRPEEINYSKKKDKTYHLNKTLKAKDKGYSLIHIFSDDWIFRKEIVKSIIKSKLNKTEKIYARKCKIKEVSSVDKVIFLNENHIQGKDHSSFSYGLFNNDEMVAIMTFCKSRYSKNYEWELSRFASKKNISVVGGFSKLLSHFRKLHRGSIGSYADRSRSFGNVYLKNGFKQVKINNPGYSYVNLNKSIQRMHRSNFTKKKIAPNDPRSEQEVMLERGYKQIFDCGTILFII